MLHKDMVDSVMKAPVNTYFEVTPIGRILNRFSKDLTAIEGHMAGVVACFFRHSYKLVQVCVVSFIAVKWVGLGLPVLIGAGFYLLQKVIPSLRESVKVASLTKSPLLSCLGETMRGASTIRAFGMKNEFIKRNNDFLNANILSIIIKQGVACWFSIRVDALSLVMMTILSVMCIFWRESVNPIVLSMLLSYSL